MSHLTTPPSSHCLQFPPTPKHGPYFDEGNRRSSKRLKERALDSAATSFFPTPARTPHAKRKNVRVSTSQGRVLFEQPASEKDEFEDKDTSFHIYTDVSSRQSTVDNEENPFLATSSSKKPISEVPPPSKDQMVYVFRGKKVVRPIPKDLQSDLKPKLLFPAASRAIKQKSQATPDPNRQPCNTPQRSVKRNRLDEEITTPKRTCLR